MLKNILKILVIRESLLSRYFKSTQILFWRQFRHSYVKELKENDIFTRVNKKGIASKKTEICSIIIIELRIGWPI